MNEQWKSNGKCADCRRRDYCTKGCSANKRALKGLLKQYIQDMVNDPNFKMEKADEDDINS